MGDLVWLIVGLVWSGLMFNWGRGVGRDDALKAERERQSHATAAPSAWRGK